MMKIRVQVKLTNACDEALVRRGFLTQERIRICEASALVDTESIRTRLPVQMVQQLGLAIVGESKVENADDSVDLTEPIGIEINGRHTTEEALASGTEVVIGRTVLAKLDLLVDASHQEIIANPAHPNGPVFRVY
jgi:hypothetical protein